MAYPSVTYSFTNGTTADASQVNTNFLDLINGISDGTKDISVSAGTFGGTLTANGAISLNNAVTINDAGADVDMRVEGDTEQNLIYVDAGNDRVGIGTATPANRFSVTGGAAQFSGTAAASAYASRADHIIFARTDLQTTYRHKITGFHTATPSSNGLCVEIASGASSYVTMVTVLQQAFGINESAPTSMLHTTDSYAKTDDYTGVLHTVSNTSSTASKTKIGMSIQSTGTWNGTSAVNVGLVVNATGGTTNYAATFSGGNVGIGTTTPVSLLEISKASSSTIPVLSVDGGASSATDNAQIAFGHNNSTNYRHLITTAHSGSVAADNHINFRLWKYGTDAAGDLGTQQVLKLTGDGTSTFSGRVTATDFLVSTASQTAFSYYRESSFSSTTWNPNTGGGNSAAFAVKYTRIGRIVFVDFPSCMTVDPNGSATYFVLNDALPDWARPGEVIEVPVYVFDNSAAPTTTGELMVFTDGVIRLYKTAQGGAWTSGTNVAGITATSISFHVA